MATEQKENLTANPAKGTQEQVTYTLDEFRAAAKKLFGYGSEVIDGAVYGKAKDSYTVEEMKKLVSDFLKKPVTKKEGE